MDHTKTDHVFDLATALGIGTQLDGPPPYAVEGFVTLRVPDGMTLRALGDCPTGRELMWRSRWCESRPRNAEAPPAGVYRLRLPVPWSNGKTVSEQEAIVPKGEVFAPVTLVAAALLCLCLRSGGNPLPGGWLRCAETAGDRVAVAWSGARLSVAPGENGLRGRKIWASSALRVS